MILHHVGHHEHVIGLLGVSTHASESPCNSVWLPSVMYDR